MKYNYGILLMLRTFRLMMSQNVLYILILNDIPESLSIGTLEEDEACKVK